MNVSRILKQGIGLLWFSSTSFLCAQGEILIDPLEPLSDFTLLADWETDGDNEGWIADQMPATIAGGVLSGTTDGGDTKLQKNFDVGIEAGSPSIVTFEVELQRSATDGSAMQLFWSDGSGGFSEPNSIVLDVAEIPTDGQFHTYRFVISAITGTINAFRLDASRESGIDLAFESLKLKVESLSPEIDSNEPINLYTVLGDFETDGDFEGWTANNINSLVVEEGSFSGITLGGDPQFVLGGQDLDSTSGDFDAVELRLRKEVGDATRIDLFWADAAGGFSPDRKVTIPVDTWPADGEFHTIKFQIGRLFTGNVTAFRLDPVSDVGDSKEVSLDYVRIGRIGPDGDNDGLADAVETNTGTFVNAQDTGTDPADDDSDGDTFLDGVEVRFGTDPNNKDEFPTASIVSYTSAKVELVRDVASPVNSPEVANGTPTGFSISPALPAGLDFDTSTGELSGTPTEASDEITYTITADFGGGLSDEFEIQLAVLNPGIIRYSVMPAVYNVNRNIESPNLPTTRGANPGSYSISPELPEGLFFSSADGSISGTPTEVTPATNYEITTSYDDYPDATFTLSVRTKAQPVVLAADNDPLSSFTSLGEWETDGEAEGWDFQNASGQVSGGILLVDTTNPDPQVRRPGAADVSLGTTLEIRSKQFDTDQIQIFWADASGGLSPLRQVVITPDVIIGDGEFHVYQVSFDQVFDGDVTFLRIDPGNIAGRQVEFDYVRIGTASPAVAPVITGLEIDDIFGEVSLTWTSSQGSDYIVESSQDLNIWIEERDGITGEADSTTVIISPEDLNRFFRIVRVD